MKILDFKYSDKSTFAILETNKGVKLKVKFGLDGVETEKQYSHDALRYLREFITSYEVMKFYENWQYNLPEKMKWLGDAIHKSLCELDTGHKFYKQSNFPSRRGKKYGFGR